MVLIVMCPIFLEKRVNVYHPAYCFSLFLKNLENGSSSNVLKYC